MMNKSTGQQLKGLMQKLNGEISNKKGTHSDKSEFSEKLDFRKLILKAPKISDNTINLVKFKKMSFFHVVRYVSC